MNFLLKVIILILLFVPNANSKDGFGEVKFTSGSYKTFIQYLTGDFVPNQAGVLQSKGGKPLGFAINQEGTYSHFYYCPKKYGDNCAPGAKIMAQNACTKESEKRGYGRCFVFAKGRVIVWDSANIRIPRKVTLEQVREIFKENGWY